MRSMVMVGLVSCVFAVAGCQSTAPTCVLENRVLNLESVPRGADVYVFNPMSQKKILIGQTPISSSVSVVVSAKGKGTEQMASMAGKVRVEVGKEGFIPYQGIIDLRDKPKASIVRLKRRQEIK